MLIRKVRVDMIWFGVRGKYSNEIIQYRIRVFKTVLLTIESTIIWTPSTPNWLAKYLLDKKR